MEIDVLKLLSYNGRGIAYADKVAPNTYKVGSHEQYGLPSIVTLEDINTLWYSYKFKVIVEHKRGGIRITFNNWEDKK